MNLDPILGTLGAKYELGTMHMHRVINSQKLDNPEVAHIDIGRTCKIPLIPLSTNANHVLLWVGSSADSELVQIANLLRTGLFFHRLWP